MLSIYYAAQKILQTWPFIFSYFGFKGVFSLDISLDVWTFYNISLIKQILTKLWTGIFPALTGQVVDHWFRNGNSSFCMEDGIKLGKRARLYQLSISGSDRNQCAIVLFAVPANKKYQMTPFITFVVKLFWVLHGLLWVLIANCPFLVIDIIWKCVWNWQEVCPSKSPSKRKISRPVYKNSPSYRPVGWMAHYGMKQEGVILA